MFKLKPSFIFSQKRGDDVGVSSVCCEYILLPLVTKETALAYGRVEYNKVGNPSRDRRGRKVESERRHVSRQRSKR